jgi:hypothetical protein
MNVQTPDFLLRYAAADKPDYRLPTAYKAVNSRREQKKEKHRPQ